VLVDAAAVGQGAGDAEGDAVGADDLVGEGQPGADRGDPGQEGADLGAAGRAVRGARRGVVPVLEPLGVGGVVGELGGHVLGLEGGPEGGEVEAGRARSVPHRRSSSRRTRGRRGAF
jgi:hypothetical protein